MKKTWLLGINIWSVDACLVAILWQHLFSVSFAVSLSWIEIIILPVTVWLVYTLDHWWDGWQISQAAVLSRHLYHIRYRWSIAIIWIVVFIVDVTLAFVFLDQAALINGLILTAFVLFYIFAVHSFVQRLLGFSKELLVGIIFSCGVCLMPFSRQCNLAMLAPAGCFTLLCTINCCFIAAWEVEYDIVQGQKSLFTQNPKWLSLFLPICSFVLVIFVYMTCIYFLDKSFAIYLSCSLSLLLLMLLHTAGNYFSDDTKRLLADFALWTPLPWILS